ncbi:hypothetical protein CA834_09855 [Winogradskyella aurantia]|uniref:Uncharacterized protein n=1 Tax=Winogradskyella aurantia TaxID=1915063 RepID=A0A265URM7_9FLAO|nr:hypothetical protein CA834_09855 [Winogradskyella aurantia]
MQFDFQMAKLKFNLSNILFLNSLRLYTKENIIRRIKKSINEYLACLSKIVKKALNLLRNYQ